MEDSLPHAYLKWTPIQRAQYLEITTLFSNYLLSSQGDRVSMAAGVECRYPFLDYEIADFAANLPDNMKIMGLNEKYIVKKLARKYVPDIITKRKKFPYRAPIDIFELMKDDFIKYTVCTDNINKYKIFNPNVVGKFLSSVLLKESPTERDCMMFLGILTTQILCELYI
jgi:asparagine synthase (glutamine-hydrolysing)